MRVNVSNALPKESGLICHIPDRKARMLHNGEDGAECEDIAQTPVNLLWLRSVNVVTSPVSPLFGEKCLKVLSSNPSKTRFKRDKPLRTVNSCSSTGLILSSAIFGDLGGVPWFIGLSRTVIHRYSLIFP